MFSEKVNDLLLILMSLFILMNKLLPQKAFLIFAIYVSLTGCQALLDKSMKDIQYKEALKLEQTANFYLHEGEPDSAMACYRRSMAICIKLDKKPARLKDTLYCRLISRDLAWIGWINDSLHKMDTGITYHLQSLKWGYKAHDDLINIAITNYNLGYDYKTMGDTIGQMSAKGLQLYKKAIKYAVAACWEYDSARNRTRLALDAYWLAGKIYSVLQDTGRQNFYSIKYNLLKADLFPGNSGNKLSQPYSSLDKGQKNNRNDKKTNSNKNIFGLPDGSDMESNSVTIQNGHTIETDTKVKNGIKTITHKKDGKVIGTVTTLSN